MRKKEDVRVIKTKAKLLEAFEQLLNERPFEDIAVNDICLGANIRRATFYKHFDDKYAFFSYFIGNLRDEFDKSINKERLTDPSFAYHVEYIKATVKFLSENELMAKNVLRSNILPTLINAIQKKNYEDICLRLRFGVENGAALPASVEILAAMMTSAVSGTILFWLESGQTIPPEQLVEEICALLSPIKKMKDEIYTSPKLTSIKS